MGSRDLLNIQVTQNFVFYKLHKLTFRKTHHKLNIETTTDVFEIFTAPAVTLSSYIWRVYLIKIKCHHSGRRCQTKNNNWYRTQQITLAYHKVSPQRESATLLMLLWFFMKNHKQWQDKTVNSLSQSGNTPPVQTESRFRGRTAQKEQK